MEEAYALAVQRLARAIRATRLSRNMSQERLAEGAGVAPRHLQDLEGAALAGKSANPTFETLWQIARTLDVPLSTLMDGEVEEPDRDRATKSRLKNG